MDAEVISIGILIPARASLPRQPLIIVIRHLTAVEPTITGIITPVYVIVIPQHHPIVRLPLEGAD